MQNVQTHDTRDKIRMTAVLATTSRGQPRLTRTLPPLLLALWLLGAAACSPRAGVTEDGDVVADGELSDFAAAEVVVDIELDGTDSLSDVVDAPDAHDADGGDVPDSQDIPYWIAHNIDIAGLGTVTSGGECDMYLKVKPGDPPKGPACANACPAPYPCTCGTCPWIETPLMNKPRSGGKAIWTGEEVLVFGGADQSGVGGASPSTLTAERWKPSGGSGFELIDLPDFVTPVVGGSSTWVQPFWTGTQSLVITDDHQFTIDPKTNLVTELPLAPAHVGNPGAMVWAGDKLFWWGWDRATVDKGLYPTPRLITWQASGGWQDVPFPSDFLVASAAEPSCLTQMDGDVFVFDPTNPRNPASGLDAAKPLMLRYRAATKVWEALPQTMLAAARCNSDGTEGAILFQSFPDGIAFIPNIGTKVGGMLQTTGEVWWKATGKWTTMATPPILHDRAPSLALWDGTRFLMATTRFDDPATGPLPGDALWTTEPTSWPLSYDPYVDQFSYTTSIGFPKHDRNLMAWAWTGSELFALGGGNGVGMGTFHRDGVRLYFPLQ